MGATGAGTPGIRDMSSTRALKIAAAASLLLACCLIGLVLNSRPRRAEPLYHGVPLSSWMRAGTNGVDQIDGALGEVGPQAIPCLARAIGAQDSLRHRVWAFLYPKLPAAIRKRYEDPAYSSAAALRRKAMMVLERWGPEAKATVPELIQIVKQGTDHQSRINALAPLAEVGAGSPEAVSTLVQALSDRRLEYSAAFAVARLGTSAKPALPALIDVVKAAKQKPALRGLDFEFMALAAIGPEATPAVPWLIDAVTNSVSRSCALEALKALGPGPAAVPALIQVLQTGSPKDRYTAAECLMRVGPAAQAAIPSLELAQRDDNPILCVLAAVALGTIRGQPESALPALTNEIKHGRFEFNLHPYWAYHVPNRVFLPPTDRKYGVSLWHVAAAAWYLGEIGPAAGEAVPLLQDRFRSGDPDGHSLAAAEAVWKITGRAELVLPHLLEAVEGRNRSARVLAIRLLGEMGPAAKPAVPSLLKLQALSLTLRREVGEALQRIDPSQAVRGPH